MSALRYAVDPKPESRLRNPDYDPTLNHDPAFGLQEPLASGYSPADLDSGVDLDPSFNFDSNDDDDGKDLFDSTDTLATHFYSGDNFSRPFDFVAPALTTWETPGLTVSVLLSWLTHPYHIRG